MRHLGLAGETGVAAEGSMILCLQQRLGEVVLWSIDRQQQRMRDALCSAGTAQQAKDILKANGYLLYEEGLFAYVASDVTRKTQIYSDDHNVYHWLGISVEILKANYTEACLEYSDRCTSESGPSRRRLNGQQLEDVVKHILKEALTVPIAPPRAGSDPQVAEIKLHIVVDAVELKHDGSVSVVAQLSEGPGYVEGRIYYGELRSGNFSLMWESPVLALRDMELKYFDANGDGRNDIVIEGEDQDRHHRVRDLTILDLEGNDLTQGRDCLALLNSDPEPGILCPIISESGFAFRKLANRTMEIKAGPPFENFGGGPRIFRIVHGRYEMLTGWRSLKRK